MRSNHGKCIIARARCPENNDPAKGTYCPCWVEVVETNDDTGETRVRKECSHIVTIDWVRNMVRGTWSAAAEVSVMRREVRAATAKRLNELEKKELEDLAAS